MALRQLIITKRISELKAKLETIRTAAAEFVTRAAALKTREAELESSVNEVTDETPEADKVIVDEAVAQFEADQATLATDTTANEADKTKLEEEIRQLETELEAINKKAAPPPAADPHKDERTVKVTMTNRTKLFPSIEQRDAFFAQQEVKDFLGNIRSLGAQKRGVTGAELGVPTIVLELLRDNMNRYSKLITRVRTKTVKGKARQNISGTVPEGIWVEAIANLNELEFSFSQIEVDGYKVGGYIAIPNSTLEDDDNLQLGTEILDMLGQAIGIGVDKAIPYGTGTKMPVGFITRLAATAQPAWWGPNQGAFTDLHTSNVLKLNIDGTTGAAFFASLVAALAVAKPNYSDGKATWLMNRTTHIALMAKALAFDAAAALVAGVNNTMPIIGGDIVELDFIPDKEIVGGFLSLYLLAEREGGNVQSSDLPLFLQDQTVFKGTARYDGKPVKGEGFVIVSYDNTEPTTSVTFGTDYANTDLGILIVTSAAGTASGDTLLTVAGGSGGTLKYKLSGAPIAVKKGDKPTGWTAVATGDDITATTGKHITVVETDASGKIVASGSTVVTAKV